MFVQTHPYNTKSELPCKLWPHVMRGCKLIEGDKCPVWGRVRIMGEAAWVGQGLCAESLYFPVKSAVNLKLL